MIADSKVVLAEMQALLAGCKVDLEKVEELADEVPLGALASEKISDAVEATSSALRAVHRALRR
jgi:hypothetical protein